MHLCFAECVIRSDCNWAADIMSGMCKPACTGNNGSSQLSAIHVSTHPAVVNGLPYPSPSPSASAIEYLAQPAPINIPTHSSHILASQPVPSSPGQTAGSAQLLINASVESLTQSVPPAQSTAHVHAPVLPHAHASSQLPLADQPGTQSQLDLLAYAATRVSAPAQSPCYMFISSEDNPDIKWVSVTQWHDDCHLRIQDLIWNASSSNLSGANVDAVANGSFSALRDHILGKEPEWEVIDVDAVDDPFISEFLTIHGLLMADTHFRVGCGLGNGVERAVYDDLFATKLLGSPYWVQVNSYWSISLPPIFSLNSTPLAEIETWGALTAVYILCVRLLPPSVSPFLILTILCGVNSLLDVDFVHLLDPQILNILCEWMAVPPEMTLTLKLHSQLIYTVSGLLSMEPRQIMEAHHHIAEGGHNMHLAVALCLAQALLLHDDQFQSNVHPHYLAFKHSFNIKFSEGLYMCQQFFNGSVKILVRRMANRELNDLQDWIDSLMWPSDVNFEGIKKFHLYIIGVGHPTHHALASHVNAEIWHCDAGDALLRACSFHRMVMGSSLILTNPMWAISFRFSDCIPNSSGPEPKLIPPLVVHSCASEVEVILTKPMINMLLERPDDWHPRESYFFDAWMHLQFALADSREFSTF
ncbi:hypothetical protein K439DRAFT_1618712 [Ramaria rubella]|nr:hypothetical protein K439DRAFT_1618712 [Ramaria rubella]